MHSFGEGAEISDGPVYIRVLDEDPAGISTNRRVLQHRDGITHDHIDPKTFGTGKKNRNGLGVNSRVDDESLLFRSQHERHHHSFCCSGGFV